MKLTKETLKEMINEVLKENHESMLLESPETDKEVLTEEVVEVEAPDSVIEAMKKASEHPGKTSSQKEKSLNILTLGQRFPRATSEGFSFRILTAWVEMSDPPVDLRASPSCVFRPSAHAKSFYSCVFRRAKNRGANHGPTTE